MRIAIVGSGIAGLAAARTLAPAHDVELFEAEPVAGGHTHTALVDGLAVDTGFIMFNRRTYPRLTRLFDELGVASRPTDVSFSSTCDRCGVELGVNRLRGYADPARWRLFAGVLAFFRAARRDLAGAAVPATERL